MKRQLNKDELALATKMVLRRKEEIEWSQYQITYHQLMLEKGLMMNYKKAKSDFEDKKKEFEEQVKMLEDVVKTLQSQIREGVEIKEDTEVEGGKKE